MARDRARRDRRFGQRLERDVVGIRKRGLVADDGAHADALFDVKAAALDDAFFKRKRLAARVLKVQVGVIGSVLENGRQYALQLRLVQAEWVEQQRLAVARRARAGSEIFIERCSAESAIVRASVQHPMLQGRQRST